MVAFATYGIPREIKLVDEPLLGLPAGFCSVADVATEQKTVERTTGSARALDVDPRSP